MTIEHRWPLLIYLDQKGWIDLAKKEYSSAKTDEDTRFLETLHDAVDESKALFPLSIVHLDEIEKISSEAKRQQLAALMVRLSGGYSFSPYIEHIIAVEADQIISEKLGYQHIDLRQVFLRRGLHHLVGSKTPTIVSRDGDENKKPPKEIEEKMLGLLYDPSVFEFMLTQALRQRQKEAIIQMNENRRQLLQVKDRDLRRRTYLAQNVLALLVPHIIERLIDRGLPKDFFNIQEWKRKDIDEFLTHIPTGLTFITLWMYSDLQFRKEIEVNDLADIWGLTLGIPYCDVVVTERHWVSIAKRSKLDKICNTIMLSSITDLTEILSKNKDSKTA